MRPDHAHSADAGQVVIDRFSPDDQIDARSLILDGMIEHWGELDPTLNPDLDDIATSYSDAVFLVGRLDQRVVATGALHARGEAGEVVRMAVASDLRRRGIGRQVVLALAEEARRMGLRRLVLETTTDWDDVIVFYESCGFNATHVEQGAWSSNTWFAFDL